MSRPFIPLSAGLIYLPRLNLGGGDVRSFVFRMLGVLIGSAKKDKGILLAPAAMFQGERINDNVLNLC